MGTERKKAEQSREWPPAKQEPPEVPWHTEARLPGAEPELQPQKAKGA